MRYFTYYLKLVLSASVLDCFIYGILKKDFPVFSERRGWEFFYSSSRVISLFIKWPNLSRTQFLTEALPPKKDILLT